MARPVETRDPSEQITILSRMLRQVDVDERYPRSRKKRLKKLITDLMVEFQAEVNGHAKSG